MIEERMVLVTNEKIYCLNPAKIMHIQADGSYTLITLEDSSVIRLSKNVKYVMGLIPADCDYLIRIHRAWAINVNKLESIVNISKRAFQLVLEGGYKVPASPKHRQDLLNLYAKSSSKRTPLLQKK